MLPRLFHFSDRHDIERFVPRPPLRHPEAAPFVYAIDEAHSPLYLFPRDCPRIGVWDREAGPSRMRLLIQREFESAWHAGKLVRYEFDPRDGFEDCDDHGVWVSGREVRPLARIRLENLPREMLKAGIEVELVDSLTAASREWFDPARDQFTTKLHVPMIRMGLLPDWHAAGGWPVNPR